MIWMSGREEYSTWVPVVSRVEERSESQLGSRLTRRLQVVLDVLVNARGDRMHEGDSSFPGR